MIKLHDYELSGNCYQVRLLAGFLDAPLERIPIDFYPGREHRSAQFRAVHPLGELPVFEDDQLVLRETPAMLMYLASRYDFSRRWLPRDDPGALGQVAEWLAFAARLTASAGQARLHDNIFVAADIDDCRQKAHALFRILDEHLWFAEQAGENWLCVGEHPTIGDVACFPDVMLSEEGGISRLAYPAIRRWTDRVKRLPKFVLMPGIFPADAAATAYVRSA